jgi:hypothetical protein
MSTLAETTERIRSELGGRITYAQATPAPRTVVLGQDELAHTWEGRPSGEVCLGIRLPSVKDKRLIDKEAIEYAISDDALVRNDPQEAFEGRRVELFVARSLCDPNNVGGAHPLFPAPDLQVTRCFTPRALNRIFDECEKLAIESSPISPEATDEDVELLCTALNAESLGGLEPRREARVRRFLWFVLDELKRSVQ